MQRGRKDRTGSRQFGRGLWQLTHPESRSAIWEMGGNVSQSIAQDCRLGRLAGYVKIFNVAAHPSSFSTGESQVVSAQHRYTGSAGVRA